MRTPPERWREVEALYHEARELPAGQREALLGRAEAGLRQEVESLLARENSASWLERPAPPVRDLTPGMQLGPYRIEERIGAGGMGQVFRGLDTRLNRPVAIKTSRDPFDARFAREAQAIAKLNHPHICTLYDVAPDFLVMELIEGETLAARLKRGRLPQEQVYRYGQQIADALAAAHAKGIVHKDLKPGNIMIAKSTLKVLDFGIARTAEDETVTASRVAVGTPAYMSPEQRAGRKCDARSDIYSLGLVLREMATGDRAGDLSGAPPQLAHVITRCLETDPDERWQAASDIRNELAWAAALKPSGKVTAPGGGHIAWAIAGLAAVGLAFAGAAFYRGSPAREASPARFVLTFDRQSELPGGTPVPSPDGQALAFPERDADGVTSIRVRRLNSLAAERLAGTEGAAPEITWSSDGAWIAFYADEKLKKVRLTGGPPETIASVPGFQDAAWGPGGDIVFRPGNRTSLYRISNQGGAVKPLTRLNAALTENSHRFPDFLPDGRHFLFVSRCSDRANNALYVGSLDSGDTKRIMPAQGRVSYIPGAILFYRDGALMAQRFNANRAETAGEAEPVLAGVAYSPPSILAYYRASRNGAVIVAAPADVTGASMFWYARSGEQTGALGKGGTQPRISPDGSGVLYQSPDPQTGNRDLWRLEFARGIKSRLTNNVANDWFGVWSPDGRQIAFASDRDGGPDMRPWLKTSMDPGSGESRLGTAVRWPIFDWSRDGLWMAFGSEDIFVVRASKPDAPFAWLATPATETGARFSPDDKWIAYSSNESGRSEIYVRPFGGGPAGSAGKAQISTGGGDYPVWGPSGEELYYMSADSAIYAADTRGLGRADTVPPPVRLFQACGAAGAMAPPLSGQPYNYAFDTNDGKKFLVVCRAEPAGRFTVLMNAKLPR